VLCGYVLLRLTRCAEGAWQAPRCDVKSGMYYVGKSIMCWAVACTVGRQPLHQQYPQHTTIPTCIALARTSPLPADGSACPTVQPPQLVTVDSPLPGRPVNLLDLCKALPPLEHLRSKCTIQLNHITLLLIGMHGCVDLPAASAVGGR
jgi:hypothetical protein